MKTNITKSLCCLFLLVFISANAVIQAQGLKNKSVSTSEKPGTTTAAPSWSAASALEAVTHPTTENFHFGSNKQSSEASVNWLQNASASRSLSFVENLGQFDFIDGASVSDIRYGVKDNDSRIYFTPHGVVYKIMKWENVSDKEWEQYIEKKHFTEKSENEEHEKQHYLTKASFVRMNWVGANSNPEIVAEDVLPNYFNYLNLTEKDKGKAIIGNAKGYKKITYKNVYPNIDIEYTIHPESGVKYSCILHPGANPSQIKMAYDGATPVLDDKHNILLSTPYGTFTDMAPDTYIGSVASGEHLSSSFLLTGKNTVGFQLAPGHETISTTTVIDPWTITPGTIPSQSADDVATDPGNNVLVYSVDSTGTNGSNLTKYNSAGTLQWTLDLIGNLEYSQYEQGDVGADNASNIYVTIGLGAYAGGYYNTCKIDPTGSTLVWGSFTATGSTNQLYESWTLSFNCAQTQLIQSGGGYFNGSPAATEFNLSTYENLNTANGAEGTLQENDNFGEIISSFWAPNNLIYHLTADSNLNGAKNPPSPYVSAGNHGRLFCVNPATGYSTVFNVKTGYHYTDGNHKAPSSVGLNAIATSCEFLYTTDGLNLDKWDLNSGAHLGNTTVTGGTNSLTSNKVNSGIVCDKCGNIYVGSNKNIYVYDQTLTLINTITGLPDVVFDLALSPNGQIIASGGTTAAKAFVASINNVCTSVSGGLTVGITQPTCGAPTGTATATVAFCGAPYIYSWSNGASTQTVSGLAPGTYTVTVSGSVTCPFTYSVTGTVTVNSPPGTPTATNTPVNVTCNGSCNGQITVNPSGGVGPYTYSWSPSGGTSATATGLCPNTYTCYITGSNGCGTTQTATITQPAVLSSTQSQTNVKCNGGNNGTATMNVSGGAGSPGYVWTPAPGAGQGTANATGLTAGTWTCVATDANSCTTQQIFTITQPTVLNVAAGSTTTSSCVANTGTASVTVSGGTPGYGYAWSPAPGGGQGTANATGMGAGTYVLTVNDANLCQQTYTVAISTAAGPSSSVLSQVNNSCNGVCIGTASINVTGGTAPINIVWSPAPGAGQGTASASQMCANTYTVTATDNNSCKTSQVFVISAPPAIAATPTTTSASCGSSTGSAIANGTGGTGMLTYSWNTTPPQTTDTAKNLPGGSYMVTITDANGCTGTASAIITNPGSPAVTSAALNPTCNATCTGKDSVSVSGGTAPYTYSWSNAATTPGISGLCAGVYTCVTHDATGCLVTKVDTIKAPAAINPAPVSTNITCNNLCNGFAKVNVSGGMPVYTYSWSNSASTVDSISGVCPNTYVCTITDANGCSTTQSFTITQPNVLSANPVTTNITCNGSNNGMACVTPSGGTSTYNYSWIPSPPTGQGTSCASGLSTGTSTCVITDANGCIDSANFTITQPPALTGIGTQANATCQLSNGQATATGGGGSPSYSYSWNSGQTTASISGLAPGIYTCTIKDSLGCTYPVSDTVTNVGTVPVPVVLNAGPTTYCQGDSLLLTATGGGVGCMYTWNPTGSNADSIYAKSGGTYTLTATNACGTVNTTDALTLYTPPVPTVTGLPTFCPGTSDTLTANSTPVTVPATTYLWSTSATTPTIIVNAAGNYTVTATNMCGVTSAVFSVGTYNINADFGPSVYSGYTPLPVNFLDSSSATAVSWTWNFGDGQTGSGQDPNHIYNNGGTYTITEVVTDSHGCKSTDTKVIHVTDLPSWITVPNIFTPNNDGDNDVWQVRYQGISEFDAKIYDRWGVMMTELFAPGQAWDGRTSGGATAVNGTYYYIITAKGDDGKQYNFTGYLMLIKE